MSKYLIGSPERKEIEDRLEDIIFQDKNGWHLKPGSMCIYSERDLPGGSDYADSIGRLSLHNGVLAYRPWVYNAGGVYKKLERDSSQLTSFLNHEWGDVIKTPDQILVSLSDIKIAFPQWESIEFLIEYMNEQLPLKGSAS